MPTPAVTTHLLYAADTAVDAPWESVPAEYTTVGTPTTRTIELGEFAAGTFGIYEVTTGGSGGIGVSEFFVILEGEGELLRGDLPTVPLKPGLIVRVAHDQYVEFRGTTPSKKFYFVAKEGAPITSEGGTFQVNSELSPIEFFTSEQTNGETVATSILELGPALGADNGLWEMGPGQADWVADDEVFVVTSGRGSLVFEDGDSFDIAAGSVVRTYAGERYQWRVEEAVRKFYVTSQAS